MKKLKLNEAVIDANNCCLNNTVPQYPIITTDTIVVGLNILERSKLLSTTYSSKLLIGYRICQMMRIILGYPAEDLTSIRNVYYKKDCKGNLEFIADLRKPDLSWNNRVVVCKYANCYNDFDFFIKNITKINNRIINGKPKQEEIEERIEQLIDSSTIKELSDGTSRTISYLKAARDALLLQVFGSQIV